MTALDPDPRSVAYPDDMPSPDYIAGREWRVVVAALVALAAAVVALWGLGLWRWRG